MDDEIDPAQSSLLTSMVVQLASSLKSGMDLSAVTLPAFVLEARSMLEKVTDFMAHPEILICASKEDSPEERFLGVVKYFLSGWHIRPKGVKKPYNPILGEFFRCRWELDNGLGSAFYVAEQVSHHPPVSAFFYCNPKQKIIVYGNLRPKSRFLGNSAATLMQGENHIYLGKHDEEYHLTMPNIYARGILFGTMYMETADAATVECPKNDLVAELDFKTKGYFSGTFCGIGGKIKKKSAKESLYSLHGSWAEQCQIEKGKKGEKTLFFDAKEAKISEKIVMDEAKQQPNESRKLWTEVTAALRAKDMDKATSSKAGIEEAQRQAKQDRADKGQRFEGKYFAGADEFEFRKLSEVKALLQDEEAATKLLNSIIFADA